MKQIVIGLAGPKGVGKSTVAAAIAKEYPGSCQVISFAEGVYKIATVVSGCSVGRLKQKHEAFSEKETIPSLVGRTPRWLLQRIGTEMVRQNIGEDVWVEIALQKAKASRASLVVIDDCRFPNEAKALDLILKLKRDGVEYTNEHETERELNTGIDIDMTELSPEEVAALVVTTLNYINELAARFS